MDFSAQSAVEAVSTIRAVMFQIPGGPPRRGISCGSPHAGQVLGAFTIPDRRPPTAPEDEETVL